MCTGRMDLAFINRALQNGADGVFIGGCWPGECHYITEGNYDALATVHLYRKLMSHVGLNPNRLRLEWVAASEGSRFAEVMNDFVATLSGLGPLGQGEGLERAALTSKLDGIGKLIPYIKLVERERLRAPLKSEEAYNAYYASEEVDRLFQDLVADKLAVSEIMTLLGHGPLSTGEIAEALKLNPSEVSRYLSSSSRHGLVQYDTGRNKYALA